MREKKDRSIVFRRTDGSKVFRRKDRSIVFGRKRRKSTVFEREQTRES